MEVLRFHMQSIKMIRLDEDAHGLNNTKECKPPDPSDLYKSSKHSTYMSRSVASDFCEGLGLGGSMNHLGPTVRASLGDLQAHRWEDRVDPTRPPRADPRQPGVSSKDEEGHDLLVSAN
ncbi:hypothetical protein PIB30_090278 [Stylosanthes scabra]|uniref:Uncharacterized protein n=1 Tax=Stylosanthes scabra TaxID=79078 RepID=A0ABU6TTQ1_9FABA|nr:hypothetical protein [Stylosanthes scabra]